MTKQQNESVSAPTPRTSPKQLAANRANALRSTGPRTLSGKQRSALNALKHGILSMRAADELLNGKQELARFQKHRDSYFETLRPEDQLQADLADQIVCNRWRMAKLLEFENIEAWRPFSRVRVRYDGADEEDAQELDDDDFVQFGILEESGLDHATLPTEFRSKQIARYRTSLNHEFFRTMAELRRLKQERAGEDGIYSVTPEDEAEPEADDGINSVPTSEEPTSEKDSENYQTKPNAELAPENNGFSSEGEDLSEAAPAPDPANPAPSEPKTA